MEVTPEALPGAVNMSEERRGEEIPSTSAAKAMPRGQGVSFWLQNRSPGAKPTPDLFPLALPSSHLPFSLNESGFSSTRGGRRERL